jgi:hypothetical protein
MKMNLEIVFKVLKNLKVWLGEIKIVVHANKITHF